MQALTEQSAQVHTFSGTVVIPWLVLILMLVGSPLVAILAAALPARRISRLPVVDALHYQ